MCEVASRCLKATWHKTWQVHRRLRPEDYAGLVEVQLNQSPGRYNGALHSSLFSASILDAIATHNGGSALLPMAFPEGSPTHPSYTAGHATVAGACLPSLEAVGDSLYAALEQQGNRPVRALQRLRALLLNAEQARLLEANVGDAGLLVERLGYLRDGRAIELSQSFYRGDMYDFVAELNAG